MNARQLPSFPSYDERWESEDLHANFKTEVAAYTRADPLPTLENLSRATGIPVGCLVRYVLVKWAASASEALLAMEPIVLQQLRAHIERAEAEDTDTARLEAYRSLSDIIAWLCSATGEKNGVAGPAG